MYRPNSIASVSQDTLLSLQQLDPSPMDSTLELDKQLPEIPPLPTRASTLGLSGSGHGMAYYLTRLQRYSSYVFTIYSAMHIANTSILPLCTQSVAASEQYLLLTRPYYQSPFLEPLLVTLPLAVHITSGVLLRLHRRNAAIRRYGSASLPPPTIQIQAGKHPRQLRFWPIMRYTSISGYVLTPLVLGHALVNRVLPWCYEGSSSGIGLGFVSHGFGKHPLIAWLGYGVLICVAAGHMTWGWAKWLDLIPDGSDSKKNRRRWWQINASSLGLASLWMAGGLGVVARGGKASGWVGSGYDKLYAEIPFLDM